MRSRTLKVSCIIGLSVVLVGAGFWLIDHNHGDRGSVSGGHFWANLKHARRNKNLTLEWFHSFSVTRSRPENLPSRMRRDIEKTLGVDPDTFRSPQYVQTHQGGIWLIWAEGSACILASGSGAVSCSTLRSAIREGLPLGIGEGLDGRARAYELLGVAPDWAKAVRLKIGKKRHTTLVHHNAYSYRANSQILLERLERG